MESRANAVEDKLIGSLDFRLGESASYIQDRRSVTFYPQTGNTYGASGVRVIKFNITGDYFLDPSTLRVMFNVQNLATGGTDPLKCLRVLSGPWCMFRRARLIIGNQVAEDIDDFNRVSEMFNILSTDGAR
jgi:hypothetical protein